MKIQISLSAAKPVFNERGYPGPLKNKSGFPGPDGWQSPHAYNPQNRHDVQSLNFYRNRKKYGAAIKGVIGEKDLRPFMGGDHPNAAMIELKGRKVVPTAEATKTVNKLTKLGFNQIGTQRGAGDRNAKITDKAGRVAGNHYVLRNANGDEAIVTFGSGNMTVDYNSKAFKEPADSIPKY